MSDSGCFVRFANFVFNDTIYCMDEALSRLAKIREVQQAQKDAAAWAALPEEEKKDQLAELRAAEENGGYYMQIANEIVRTSAARLPPAGRRPLCRPPASAFTRLRPPPALRPHPSLRLARRCTC